MKQWRIRESEWNIDLAQNIRRVGEREAETRSRKPLNQYLLRSRDFTYKYFRKVLIRGKTKLYFRMLWEQCEG